MLTSQASHHVCSISQVLQHTCQKLLVMQLHSVIIQEQQLTLLVAHDQLWTMYTKLKAMTRLPLSLMCVYRLVTQTRKQSRMRATTPEPASQHFLLRCSKAWCGCGPTAALKLSLTAACKGPPSALSIADMKAKVLAPPCWLY